MTKKFYITTPIYYVNARPHIGHAYTTIACDTIARRHRMLGDDTWFLTGTDEHGQKIERAAQAAGKTPQQFTDEISAEFRALWKRMGLTPDDFIRTTSARHKQGVQALWRKIRDNGYIYKGTYTGQYCVSDELYVDAEPGAPCPDCGRPTETVHEENYYFKLSAFQDQLIRLYTEQPDFIRPETRRNEVLVVRARRPARSFHQPLDILLGHPRAGRSRSTWSTSGSTRWRTTSPRSVMAQMTPTKFDKYWPADVHMIGKEIVRFHCVYWPAFLLAAGLPLPKGITAHGWLLFEESKMSKSRGNIVRAETIVDVLGTDALRYFLLREVVFGQDGSFSFDALVQRYNSDLANGLGNLASRTLTMITRYFKGEVPYPSNTAHTPADAAIAEAARKAIADYGTLFDQYQFSRALETAWGLVSCRGQIHRRKRALVVGRKKQDEESRARLATVLYTSAEALRIVTALAHPVMPDATAKDLGADGPRRHREIRPDRIAVGTTAARHKVGRGAGRVSAGRQIGSREDAENGRKECKCGDGRLARPAERSSANRPRAQPPRPRQPSQPPPFPMAKSPSTTSRK